MNPATTKAMTRKLIVTRFHLLLLGVLVAITATAFVKIKAEVGLPVHWGLNGQPDQIWPRNQALVIFPVIGVLLTALFGAIGRFAPPEQVEPGRYVAEAMLSGLLLLLCALQLSFILIGIGSDIDLARIVAFGLALILLLLGFTLPNSAPNAYAGVRLPWSMKDRANWTATHRLTGALYVVAGLGLAAVAWFRPDPVDMLPAIAVAVLVPILIGGMFSFIRRQR
jgi:uncharacterized membrane protein